MKFMISRTSIGYIEKPCDEATKEKYIRVDQRTFQSEEEHNNKLKRKWRDKGQNHRITETGIARDFEDEDWFIRINTFKGLINFLDKYGKIVINPSSIWNKDISEIEIYDDWRE